MTNVYTQNKILDRNLFSGSCSALTTILSARVKPEASVLEMILREDKIGRPEHAQHNGFCFNLGTSRNTPRVYNFTIESDDVYIPLLRELGADYDPRGNKKVIAQVRGKQIFTYSKEGKVIAVQPLRNEYSDSRPINLMSGKKASGKDNTEYLHAYAMFDMGKGESWFWNEITFATCVLSNGRYKQRTSQIKKAEFDEHLGELELTLKKRSLRSDYTFILFYESSINLFLGEYGVEGIGKIRELEGKKVTVLFTDSDHIDWVIPCIEPVKKQK